MPFRSALTALAIGCLLATAGAAGAQQIYKWKDANGVVHFSQSPPAHGAHYQKVQLNGIPEVSTKPAAAAGNHATQATTTAAMPASTPNHTLPDTPANRAHLCKQLTANIALLDSKQPVVLANQQGKQQLMSDDAREQQLATARAQQKQYCAQP